MLDLSRMNSETLRIDRMPTHVDEFVLSTVESLGPTARERNQKLRFESGTRNVTINADKGRLIQVLSNLITNASKYSPDGTSIDVRTAQADGWVEISVSDSGCGMDESELRMLFSPFYRSSRNEVQSQSGTGLGMSISRTLVELHGGEINVESQINIGTKVRVRIPHDADSDDPE